MVYKGALITFATSAFALSFADAFGGIWIFPLGPMVFTFFLCKEVILSGSEARNGLHRIQSNYDTNIC